jgi:hypothetical protein
VGFLEVKKENFQEINVYYLKLKIEDFRGVKNDKISSVKKMGFLEVKKREFMQ